MRRRALAVVLLVLTAGCGHQRPLLYPNRQLEASGVQASERDIDHCLEMAKLYGVESKRAGRVVGSTATGGAVGGAAGAAAGAVRGDSGRRAGAGAAGGAAAGFLLGLIRWRQPDALERRFVEVCLRDQGYRPIGWR